MSGLGPFFVLTTLALVALLAAIHYALRRVQLWRRVNCPTAGRDAEVLLDALNAKSGQALTDIQVLRCSLLKPGSTCDRACLRAGITA